MQLKNSAITFDERLFLLRSNLIKDWLSLSALANSIKEESLIFDILLKLSYLNPSNFLITSAKYLSIEFIRIIYTLLKCLIRNFC